MVGGPLERSPSTDQERGYERFLTREKGITILIQNSQVGRRGKEGHLPISCLTLSSRIKRNSRGSRVLLKGTTRKGDQWFCMEGYYNSPEVAKVGHGLTAGEVCKLPRTV